MNDDPSSVVVAGIEKSSWGDGPWQVEPDEVSWSFGDVPCRIVRHPRDGYWLGYIAVSPSHPWCGVAARDIDLSRDPGAVQHQLSFSGRFDATTHALATSESLWWVGFDCDHVTDFAPGRKPITRLDREGHYWTVADVRGEVEQLARWAIRANMASAEVRRAT